MTILATAAQRTGPLRILSLTAGGVRALLQTSYLAEASQLEGVGQFWRHMDLIIGTSAGAVVAAGLWADKSPQDITGLLIGMHAELIGEDLQSRMERVRRGLWALLSAPARAWNLGSRGPIFNQHKVNRIKGILQEAFGPSTLGARDRPSLAITATALQTAKVRVFSPWNQERDQDVSVIDALMASTALPGFFPPYSVDGRDYIDGYLWANCPILAAVTLALEEASEEQPPIPALRPIRVLSIGAAARPFSLSTEVYGNLRKGSAEFYRKLYKVTSAAAENAAHEAVERLIKPANFLHIDEPAEKKIGVFDLETAREKLPALAARLARNEEYTRRLRDFLA